MVDLDTLELIQRLHDFDVYDCTLAAHRLEEQANRLASKDAELNAAEDSHAAEKRELLTRVDTLEVVVSDLHDLLGVRVAIARRSTIRRRVASRLDLRSVGRVSASDWASQMEP